MATSQRSPGPRNHSSRGGSGRGGPPPSPSSPHSSSGPSSSVPYGFLPPYLPGSASLVEQLDRRLLIVLRDGRHLIGVLRSFDQFSNMVLEETSERRFLHMPGEKGSSSPSRCYYADVRLGLYLIRGDSVVLLGEVGPEELEDEEGKGPMKRVSLEELEELMEKKKRDDEGGGDGKETVWDFDTDLVV